MNGEPMTFGPPPVPESSTFLRYMGILAAKAEGDFEFDDSRSIIKLSHIWVAEATSQEDKHDRYTNSTFFILSCIAPIIDDLRETGNAKDSALVEKFDDLEAELSACHIVIVSTQKEEYGHIDEIKMVTRTGRKDEDEDLTTIKGSEISAPLESYSEALREARENGFRRINCTARMLYYRSLKLAHRVGYIDPEEGVDLRCDSARAEDLRSEEGRIRERK